MPLIKTTLGETIRVLRQRKGLNLRQLADKCGLSHAAIALYETGKTSPPVDKLERICAALEVEIEQLLK